MKVSIIISSIVLALVSVNANAESVSGKNANQVAVINPIGIKSTPIRFSRLLPVPADTTINELPNFIAKSKSEIIASDNQIIEAEIAPVLKLNHIHPRKISPKPKKTVRL